MRIALALMLCAAACGGDDSHSLLDAARVDAKPDAMIDAGPDAAGPHLTITDAEGNPVSALTFVNVYANGSAAQSFFVKNDGGQPTAALDLATAAPFTIDTTTTCNGSLASGAMCRVAVKFAPAQAGVSTGNVALTAGDLTGSVALNATSLTSLDPETSGGASITAIAFGAIDVGSVNSSTFFVKNLGSTSTFPLVTTITGAGFSIDLAQSTCSGGTIVASATCSLKVVFAPETAGPVTGGVTIASGEDAVTVDLSGTTTTTTPALLQLDMDTYDFGTVTSASPFTTIHLTNVGGTAAPIDSYDIADPSGSFFLFSTTCGASLAGGDECTFDVQFAPEVLGAHPATFEVISAGLPTMASLTGSGAIEVDVALAGTGTGEVFSDPTGVDCGTACSIVATSDVTLSEEADDGSQFTAWDYAGCDANPTCELDFVGSVTVTATFDLNSP